MLSLGERKTKITSTTTVCVWLCVRVCVLIRCSLADSQPYKHHVEEVSVQDRDLFIPLVTHTRGHTHILASSNRCIFCMHTHDLQSYLNICQLID